jgi:UDP-N-acetyl-2-amino-2-deoxyglucuronate dehydrogenase
LSKLRYGLIGCGRISKKHMEAAINIDLDIVTVCDKEIIKCSSLIDTLLLMKIETTSDTKSLINDFELDVISIATSSEQHYDLALEIIKKGVNVIIEKPLSLSLKHIDSLIRLAKEKRVAVTVCHQNRFNPPVQRLYKSIKSNNLGKLFYGVASIRWNRKESYYSQANWRGKWKSDGGALMNQSIHNIDLLLWMMGSPVIEVFGYIDNKKHPSIEVEDMGVALLKFANGSFGIIESSMNTYPENFEETLSIFGEKGTVVLGGKSVNKINHWNVMADPIDDLEVFNEEVDSVYGNGHIALYKDFIDAIEKNREPAISLQDGRNAVEVILAIYKSSFEKRPVQLPLSSDTSTIMFKGKSFK